MRCFDILIVGNGVIGLSTAYALIKEEPSLKVGVIGRLNRNNSASEAAGAMLGCFGEITTSTLKSEYNRAKLEIGVKAAKMWPLWLEEINSHVQSDELKINLGTHLILNTKSGKMDSDNYESVIKALNIYQEPYQEISPLDIPGFNPIADCRPIRSLYLPNEGSINPFDLLQKLQEILHKNPSVSLIDDLAKNINIVGNKAVSLTTISNHTIQADTIVLAAGSESQQIIDQIPEIKNRIPRLFYGVGNSIVAEHDSSQIQTVIRTSNRSFACGLHVLPRSNSSVYIGATNNVELLSENYPRMGNLRFLQECAIEQINQGFHNFKVMKCHTGFRPVTVDTFPLIGNTCIDHLWLLTGTYRDGIHSSPLLATYLAKKILYNTEIFQNVFFPERLPIQTMNQSEAIAEAVSHYLAGAYEHSMRLPRVGWDKMFEEMLYVKIANLYKKLNLDFVLSSDLLLMFDQNEEKHINFFKNYNEAIFSEYKSQIETNLLHKKAVDLIGAT